MHIRNALQLGNRKQCKGMGQGVSPPRLNDFACMAKDGLSVKVRRTSIKGCQYKSDIFHSRLLEGNFEGNIVKTLG